MPQKLTATQAHSALMGAGCPEEVVVQAQAKNIDLNLIWEAWNKASSLWSDTSKTTTEKIWGTFLIVLTLIPAAGSAPA